MIVTALNYVNCYKITRVYEGGNDDDPRDPGGRTSRGIIQREYDKYRDRIGQPHRDVWLASESEIAEIYRTGYWDTVFGDQWPDGPDLVVWDCAVNSGPARSKSIAGACLPQSGPAFSTLAMFCENMPDKTIFVKAACKKRLSFLEGLRTFVTFGKGWTRRVASVEANGVRMALVGASVATAEIKRRLEDEATAAKNKSKAHAGGVVGGTGTGGSTSQLDWHTMDWLQIGAVIAGIAGLVVLVLWFAKWMKAHNERAIAYTQVASVTEISKWN